MEEISIKLTPRKRPSRITIGTYGEYGIVKLLIDLSEYASKYGTGTASVLFTPALSNTSYLLASEYDASTSILSTVIGSTETKNHGEQTINVLYQIDGGQAIAEDIKVNIIPTGSRTQGDAPDDVETWVEKATRLLDDTTISSDEIDTIFEEE